MGKKEWFNYDPSAIHFPSKKLTNLRQQFIQIRDSKLSSAFVRAHSHHVKIQGLALEAANEFDYAYALLSDTKRCYWR